MKILSVEIKNLRNLKIVELSLCPGHNLLVGANGAGKTSVLEAIHLLGYGRSFRTRLPKDLIKRQEPELVVSCSFVDSAGIESRAGVSKGLSTVSEIRLNGQTLNSSSELAWHFPVMSFESGAFDLLDGGPKERRQALDWGVFHVEHSFAAVWKSYRRVLAQRNALLKVNDDKSDYIVWNQQLVELSTDADRMRKVYFERFVPVFIELLEKLAPELSGISVEYQRGWSADKSLAEVLEERFKRDRFEKRTTKGGHAADLHFFVEGNAAKDCLSRGQKKILVVAFKCAQASLYNSITNNSCVLLLDDLASELDADKWQKVLTVLDNNGCQTLQTYTELDRTRFLKERTTEHRMFHVEQGEISLIPLPH